MIAITLLGTGSPMPDPDRAGPATLIQAGGENYVVDCGRGVVMRLVAAGVAPGAINCRPRRPTCTAITSPTWATSSPRTGSPRSSRQPLRIVGPPGIRDTVDHIVASLGPDISYRIAHHDDLDRAPLLVVTEVASGPLELGGTVTITAGPTDHKPVDPSIGFRFDHEGTAVVVAGDTVPCAGLDALCAGSDALVHTVIRKDIIANIPIPRLQDTLDYHSSPEEAAQTAARAGVGTLVLTHYVPAFPSGGGDDWKALAAEHFAGRVELGDDLHRIEIDSGGGS